MPRLRDKILSNFPSPIVEQLIEFNRHVSNIDADYIVFMARKALRLHDMLAHIGGAQTKRLVFSDNILDQSLVRFKGKKLALIDDTLILGSTLGRTVSELRRHSRTTQVETHVFALDRDNWCKKLITPDHVFCRLSQQEMLNFCASEVRALAQAGIPYLTYFPLTKAVRLSSDAVRRLDMLKGWSAHDVTDTSFSGSDVLYITFLPSEEMLNAISDKFVAVSFDVVDIVKVRLFLKRSRAGFYSGRFVPIVTLSPLSDAQANELFETITRQLFEWRADSFTQAYKSLETIRAKVRFCQYVMSADIGRLFLDAVKRDIGLAGTPEYDLNEGIRQFGPWFREELVAAHAQSLKFLFPAAEQGKRRHALSKSAIPRSTYQQASEEFQKVFAVKGVRRNFRRGDEQEIAARVSTAFVKLFHLHELPARREAHRLGRKIFSNTGSSTSHRNRLAVGFPWHLLARHIVPYERKLTHSRVNYASLYLDNLIDLGIAVPILSHREGVIFRAYRHGEDVLLNDQALVLCHEVCAGFMKEARASDIPRIALEKSLVTMFRGAPSRGLLTGVYGSDPKGEVIRVGFHLHGAVSLVSRSDNELLADKVESRLSTHRL